MLYRGGSETLTVNKGFFIKDAQNIRDFIASSMKTGLTGHY